MMTLGAQLYTLRDYLQSPKDISRSLSRVAKMGYKTLQVSGLGKIDPLELRKICDSEGLSIVITHSDMNRILNDTDRLIEEHEIMGCKYIGLGAMSDRYRGNWWVDCFIEDFREPAEKMAKVGKMFMYHNHSFEFARLNPQSPKLLMDCLLEGFSPELMGITLDTYWVQAAGGDVTLWLEKLAGRIPCVHLKDMAVSGFSQKMAPVGEGNMNFKGILSKLKELGCTEHLLVEQDTCEGSPFECLETSYRNVTAMLAEI